MVMDAQLTNTLHPIVAENPQRCRLWRQSEDLQRIAHMILRTGPQLIDESNRGRHVWFVADMAELEAKLSAAA